MSKQVLWHPVTVSALSAILAGIIYAVIAALTGIHMTFSAILPGLSWVMAITFVVALVIRLVLTAAFTRQKQA